MNFRRKIWWIFQENADSPCSDGRGETSNLQRKTTASDREIKTRRRVTKDRNVKRKSWRWSSEVQNGGKCVGREKWGAFVKGKSTFGCRKGDLFFLNIYLRHFWGIIFQQKNRMLSWVRTLGLVWIPERFWAKLTDIGKHGGWEKEIVRQNRGRDVVTTISYKIRRVQVWYHDMTSYSHLDLYHVDTKLSTSQLIVPDGLPKEKDLPFLRISSNSKNYNFLIWKKN